MEPIVGIDLGTTNSVIAIVENGIPRVITDPDSGEGMLPSVVGVDPAGQWLVGRMALNQAALFPGSTVRSIKRKMGQDVRVKLGERDLSPPEISAVILGRLRQWAEQDLGRPVTKAVITVPAYFDDNQREATRLAGELAGLEVMRIINEPTAAALVYDPKNADPQRILVYDLGGGTFDVSIVAIEAGVVEVLATHGDTQLGGDDFDALLAEKLIEASNEFKAAVRKDAAAMARLSISAEAAKRRLSFDTFTTVAEEFLLPSNPNSHLQTILERAEYEASIDALLERTITCVDDSLAEAGMHAAQLDRVILVGGSTRTPLVEQKLIHRLHHQPCTEVDPDLCVALGAAVQGALLAGQDVEKVLVDITPHTLGIRCADSHNPYEPANLFAPMIARGSALPCKRSETFYTVTYGQGGVDVDVYQGESPVVTNNRFVGQVRLEGLDPRTPPDSPISITFSLNLNGMLEVRAVDRASGKEAVATINRSEGADAESALTMDERLNSQHEIASWLGRASNAESVGAENETDQPALVQDNHLVQRLQLLAHSVESAQQTACEQDACEIDSLVTQLHDAASVGDSDAFDRVASKLEDLLFYLNEA